MDINVFAKFYEIPSMPFQDIKPKCCGQTDNMNTVYPCSLVLKETLFETKTAVSNLT